MKTIVKFLIIFGAIIILCFVGHKVVDKIKYKTEIARTLNTIPEFTFETIDGEVFNRSSLSEGKAIVFVYFNSECDYCKQEALSIQEHIEKFKNVQLIFVSAETKDNIQEFAKQYKLDVYDFVYFLFDLQDDFSNRFDANATPYVLIYDENKKLIKRHKGVLEVENMLEILKKSATLL